MEMKFDVTLRSMVKNGSVVMTIPKPIVDNFEFTAGTELEFVVKDNEFNIRKKGQIMVSE